MPQGKGYPDQFGLGKTEKSLGRKRLSEQPKSSRDVKGIGGAEMHNRGLPGGPNGKHDVPGSKIQGPKS